MGLFYGLDLEPKAMHSIIYLSRPVVIYTFVVIDIYRRDKNHGLEDSKLCLSSDLSLKSPHKILYTENLSKKAKKWNN